MASGTYGIVRPADVTPDDIEIFYDYTPSRDTQSNGLTKITNASDLLIKVNNPNRTQSGVSGFEMFGGLYTLKLPVSIFNAKGFYTIIIKPIEIRTSIVDVGVLSAYPNVNGLLIDMSAIPTNLANRFENNGLTGYRVEYLNLTATDAKVHNTFTVITSNNRAEAVNQNLTDSNQKAIRYRFNDNSTLIFCTVTPNSASVVNTNAVPFIGQPNQQVVITNTFFNPIMIELELVDNDIETLAYGIFGNQSKSLEDGKYTIYNFSNQIFAQYDLYEIKDTYSGVPLFEIREQRNNIDFSKNFSTITTV